MKSLAPPLQQVDRTYVRFRGRKLSYFGGCDYFRLSSHPKVIRAMDAGLTRFGLNVAASRATTGNHRAYEQLEAALAKFFDAEAALLVSNGFATNLVVAQALAGQFSHALLDERAHSSLIDAAQFLDCPVVRFKHRDAGDVARVIQRLGRAVRPILLTDGMFSRDGSVAPLKSYLQFLPRDAWLLVDDAHGAGVLGEEGRGTIEHEGVSRRRIIQTTSLSKAFGVFGGAILASHRLWEQVIARSRLFTGSTPLPLPLAHAALEAVKMLKTEPRLRAALCRNADYVKTALRKTGFPLSDFPGPIISVIPRHDRDIASLRRELLARKIFPVLTRYPGAPANGYFRFVISSEHNTEQLDNLVQAVAGARAW